MSPIGTLKNCDYTPLQKMNSSFNGDAHSFSSKKALISSLFLTSIAILTNGLSQSHSIIAREFPESLRVESEPLCGNLYPCLKMDFNQEMCPLDSSQTYPKIEKSQHFYNKQQCPYGSSDYNPLNQYDLLPVLPNNHVLINYFINPEFEYELEKFNKNTPDYTGKPSKSIIVNYAMNGDIDITKLFQGAASPEDPTQIKLLKSLNGIRMAKPGDKDIALILLPHPSSDHNGAFRFGVMKAWAKDAWIEISKKHPIYFAEVSSLGGVHRVAERAKQEFGNIKMIQLMGHGEIPDWSSAHRITLSESHDPGLGYPRISSFDWENIPELPIDSDGTILIDSCHSGKGGINYRGNSVNQIALRHPGVTVMGYRVSAAAHLKVIDIDQRKFEFIDTRYPDLTYRAKSVYEHLYKNWMTDLISPERFFSLGLSERVLKEV